MDGPVDNLGIEPRHAAGPAEEQLPVIIPESGSEMELVVLQPVIGIVAGEAAGGRVQVVQAVGGGYPERSVPGFQDGAYDVAGQSVGFAEEAGGAPVAVAGGEPFARPDPDGPVLRFIKTIYARVDGDIPDIVSQEFAGIGIVAERPVERSQPQGPPPVGHQGAHPLVDILDDVLFHFPRLRGNDAEPRAIGAGIQAVLDRIVGKADDIPGSDGILVGEGAEACGRGIGEKAVQVGGGP